MIHTEAFTSTEILTLTHTHRTVIFFSPTTEKVTKKKTKTKTIVETQNGITGENDPLWLLFRPDLSKQTNK